jgi:hypothetical protein
VSARNAILSETGIIRRPNLTMPVTEIPAHVETNDLRPGEFVPVCRTRSQCSRRVEDGTAFEFETLSRNSLPRDAGASMGKIRFAAGAKWRKTASHAEERKGRE